MTPTRNALVIQPFDGSPPVVTSSPERDAYPGGQTARDAALVGVALKQLRRGQKGTI